MRRGFSLVEVLVAVVVLSLASTSLYFLLRASVKSVERTEEHMVAYCLLEKIAEEMKARMASPEKKAAAIALEVDGVSVMDFVQKDEDFKGTGSLQDWKDLAASLSGKKEDVAFVDRMMRRFFVTIKNASPVADMADLQPAGKAMPAGVRKQIWIAWKTKDQKSDRHVCMDVTQPIFSNYLALARGGYGDNPLFTGEAATAFNRSYRTALKLARAKKEAESALQPPSELVFQSNDFWPTEDDSMLIRGHTRINVKLVLLERVLGMSRQELISLDTKYGGATHDLDQSEKKITRDLVETALSGNERGQGRPSSRFIQALDSMRLKCVSCHSKHFFKTDPELKGQANLFLPKEHQSPVGTKDGAFSGNMPLSEAKHWAQVYSEAEMFVDPETGQAHGDPGDVIPAEEMKRRLEAKGGQGL